MWNRTSCQTQNSGTVLDLVGFPLRKKGATEELKMGTEDHVFGYICDIFFVLT